MNVLINKIILVFLLCITFSFISTANQLLNQGMVNDSVYTEIVGDTVKIWDKQILENCCSIFIHELIFSGDSITVIEKDTSTNYCRCMCYFDLCATIISLNAGSYRVFVYRTYALEGYDSLYFIDSTSFVYSEISMIEPKIVTYQSECFNPLLVQEEARIPKGFILEQNFPNPFNPSTTINYQLPIDNYVTIKIYNMLGQEVATLVDGLQKAGYKTVEWDASKYPSGVYIYRIYTDKFIGIKKLLLIK